MRLFVCPHIGILYYGAGLVVEGEMSAGVLTSYLIYCMALAGSIGGLVGTYGLVMTAAGANRRVFELLDAPPPRIPLQEGRRLDPASLQCSIRFEDVCFSYPTRKDQAVLHNVSFSVAAGQKVALVGRSGCGKSTIMNLMMRFYDPTSGTITFGGHPLSEIQPAWLHQNFGLVAQEPLLFGCTIAENIAFGVDDGDGGDAATAKAREAVAKAVPEPVTPMGQLRSKFGRAKTAPAGASPAGEGMIGLDGLPMEGSSSSGGGGGGGGGGGNIYGGDMEAAAGEGNENGKLADDPAVMDAARMCNAHDFIMSFEEGYQTLVGERGVQLSGGQKQRVAIARAVRRNPVMLLLDEATSALDSESEHLVQSALDKLMVGRTTVIVAHRLSTVINSDVVVVLDKGCFAGCGTHDELVRTNRVYRKLVQHQLPVPPEEQAQPEPQSSGGGGGGGSVTSL
jgi:ABC-type multidrug transport system fused ATPase/permease subunit